MANGGVNWASMNQQQFQGYIGGKIDEMHGDVKDLKGDLKEHAKSNQEDFKRVHKRVDTANECNVETKKSVANMQGKLAVIAGGATIIFNIIVIYVKSKIGM